MGAGGKQESLLKTDPQNEIFLVFGRLKDNYRYGITRNISIENKKIAFFSFMGFPSHDEMHPMNNRLARRDYIRLTKVHWLESSS